MPLTRIAADAFGVVTISLVSLFAILGLLCIFRSVYFRFRIQRQGYAQLSYFSGPWITRIALILVAIWWCFGEIVRLSLLKGRGRLFSSVTWQKDVCKFYILSNLGFAEPSIFLTLVFLLHASLQKRESGALGRRWNRKTLGYVLFFCLPVFMVQLVLVFFGPKFNKEKSNERTKIPNYFTSTSVQNKGVVTCTYPLLSTIFLGLFDILLISYVSYIGSRMLSLVINKGLRRRVYLLIFSIILFLPLRVLLLAFSVLPSPGNLAFEAIVFLSFLMLLFCTMVGISMLVYYPVADSMSLRDIGPVQMEEMPYDDYYYDGASLIANQSQLETGRTSDASKRGSISFRAMVKDELPPSDGGDEVVGLYSPGALNIVSAPGSSTPPPRPMFPLREVSNY